MALAFRTPFWIAASALLVPAGLAGQAPRATTPVLVGVVKNPYQGSRNVPELSLNPDYVQAGGLEYLLTTWGAKVDEPVKTVRLTSSEAKEYGEWNRLGLANGHLARIVADYVRRNRLAVALEGNCNSTIGMLGGLQQGPDGGERRVGLVYFDAHGDFNTPETTLSGMLGGMPVAVSVGDALQRIRVESGLKYPIPVGDIVWGGVRDLDPLEAERLDQDQAHRVSVDDINTLSQNFRNQISMLASNVDVIYVHVDMDVLAPDEVPGHHLKVPGGPSSKSLAAAVRYIFQHYPKAVAFGVASTPAGSDDPAGVSRQAALNLIQGAVDGVRAR